MANNSILGQKMSSQRMNKIFQNLTIGGGGTSNAGLLQINGNSNNSVFSFGEAEGLQHELVRKYEIYESTEDLLALSCAWLRMRKESKKTGSGINISKLIDRQLFKTVNDEDRLLASSIRDYYSKKIMLWKLKNQPLTPYREDLNSFIHSDGLKFVEKMFGLAYRLPEFYHYDVTLDGIFKDKNKELKKLPSSIQLIKSLQYVGKTLVDRRSIKRDEYWFVDEQNNVSVILLGRDNPLLNIWEQVIQKPIKINGLYYAKNKDGRDYFQIEKYNLVI